MPDGIEEDPLAHPAFPGGDGQRRGAGELRKHIHALHRHRFFHEERAIRGEGRHELQRDAGVRIVQINGHLHIPARTFPDRAELGGEAIDGGGRGEPVTWRKVDFEAAEAPVLYERTRGLLPHGGSAAGEMGDGAPSR